MIRSNIDDVLRDLEAAKREIKPAVVGAIDDSAREIVADLEAASPVASGKFRASWAARSTSMGAEIDNDAPYASFVDVNVDAAVRRARIGDRIEEALTPVLE